MLNLFRDFKTGPSKNHWILVSLRKQTYCSRFNYSKQYKESPIQNTLSEIIEA